MRKRKISFMIHTTHMSDVALSYIEFICVVFFYLKSKDYGVFIKKILGKILFFLCTYNKKSLILITFVIFVSKISRFFAFFRNYK